MSGVIWSTQEMGYLRKTVLTLPSEARTTKLYTKIGIDLGRSMESIRLKVRELLREEPQAADYCPPSSFPLYNKPIEVTGDALILGDLHAPYHDGPFISKCIAVAKAWKLDNLIVGGDLLDLGSLGSFTPNFTESKPEMISPEAATLLRRQSASWPSKYKREMEVLLAENEQAVEDSFPVEIREAKKVVHALDDSFEHIYYNMGNHEQRLLRKLFTAMSIIDLGAMLQTSKKWQIAPYFYSILYSGGKKWMIEHPHNSAKGSSKRLSSKYTSNVVMLHGHHFSVQSDPSGEFISVEPGACADINRLDYEQMRHGIADMHITGALMIVNGFPWLLNNKMTDWEAMLTGRNGPEIAFSKHRKK